MARTGNQRRDASRRHQELNREVKRGCRRDKRVYVESMAERAEEAGRRDDVKTLHEITRKLSGRFRSTCKPVRNETACCSGQRSRRCPSGGSTLKECFILRSLPARQRWSQATS